MFRTGNRSGALSNSGAPGGSAAPDEPVNARVHKGASTGPAWVFLGSGLAAVALHAVGPSGLQVPLFLATVVGSVVATIAGALWHQVRGARRAWWMLCGAEIVFFCGALLRLTWPQHGGAPSGVVAVAPDAMAVVAYVLLMLAFLHILRRRRASDDDPASTDALLIGLVAALAAWTLLIEPYLGSANASTTVQRAAAFFPMMDVLLLVMITQLMLAGAVRQAALWLLGAALGTMFAADLVYAMLFADSQLTGPWMRIFDAMFILAYVPLGAAALHPTMRTLTEPQRVILKELGWVRTVGIAAALVAPSVIAMMSPPTTSWSGVVRLILTILLTGTIVARIVGANNSRVRTELAAQHRATHDALTDLPNRELLTETITSWCERAVAEGQEISLLFLDLDRFKMVNDNWGHEVGDELLCAVADRLSLAVRDEDLVCRVGGDEFVVALACPGRAATAESLAQRLLADFAAPFRLSVGEVVITPSIGVARSSGAVQALALIRDADTAMYKAKDSGRNAYAFFDDSLRERVRARVNLEQALRGALDRGELSVHYQPIVDLRSQELSGFEALMRWHNPQLGAVSPLEFIPIAEDTGMIVASGEWLLEEAVTQLARWRAERTADQPSLHVSVNVSVRQLRDESLVGAVRRVLDQTALPASALWLEITESGMMEDPETSLMTLRALRDLGVTLCVDDFGTGYSSLSYLKRFPVGIVKIDRAFVSGLGDDSDDEAIVRTIVAMAHALGQQVVAEGIETAVQRDRLRGLGCDLAQGWLYGAPRPAESQLGWVRAAAGSSPMESALGGVR